MATIDELKIKVKWDNSDAFKGAEKLKDIMGNIKPKGLDGIKQSLQGISNGAKSATGHLSTMEKFALKFKGLATFRLIRMLIANITQGIQEGVRNFAMYDKAIGGLANANYTMSSLATTFLMIKNTVGVTATSILQILRPAILSIADAFISVMNAFNAFLAMLQGNSTFYKAKEVWVDYAGSLNKAGSAAKEIKNQLMGFDELNILKEGTGSGYATDYSGMFEPADVEQYTFMSKIMETLTDQARQLAENFGITKDNAKEVFTTLGLIAGAISFHGLIGQFIALTGAFEMLYYFSDMWANGISWENFTGVLKGVAIAAVGLTLAGGPMAGIFAVAAGGITLATAALIEWINTGKMSTEAFSVLLTGFGMLFAAFGALTGSWIPLAIAAGMELIAWGVRHFPEFSEAWDGAMEDMKEGWTLFKDWIWDGINKVFEWFTTLAEKIKSVSEAFRDFLKIDAQTGAKNVINKAVNIEMFAGGGTFPNQGQLFIANEAGPELVSSWGGRTTVTNQEQLAAGLNTANEDVIDMIYNAAQSIVGAVNSIPQPVVKIGNRDIMRAYDSASALAGGSMVKRR